jgi:phosphatidylserine/phosphatidylglycerophosphate/cardiolipin synthase-like enzyme
MKRDIKFRMITHRPSTSEGGKPPSDAYEVFSEIAEEHTESIRILTKLHARLLITDKEALVSTADLTKDSLEAKYEAGISTTDGLAIMKTKEFFEKLWAASTKLKTPKTGTKIKT